MRPPRQTRRRLLSEEQRRVTLGRIGDATLLPLGQRLKRGRREAAVAPGGGEAPGGPEVPRRDISPRPACRPPRHRPMALPGGTAARSSTDRFVPEPHTTAAVPILN